MKLSFNAVKSITFGAVKSFENSSGMNFARCTDKQIAAYYGMSESIGNNSKASTGIRFDFHTNSKRFAFKPSDGQFDIYVNGAFTERYVYCKENPVFSRELPREYEENHVTVYFPSHGNPAVISYVEIDDGAYATPHKYDMKLYFIGDSITQGWDTGYDSLSYSIRTADFFNAEPLIQGVGGAVFGEGVIDGSIEFDPDAVIFALGTNDWGTDLCKSFDDIRSNAVAFMDALKKQFPDKPVFGILPIWRADEDVARRCGTLSRVRDVLKEEISSHGFTVVDGLPMVPHIKEFYSDGYLHPNALGAVIYAENLCKVLNKYFKKN